MTADKTKQQKQLRRQVNVLESLRDDVFKEGSAEVMRQLGMKARTKASGEIQRGESLVMNDAMTGKQQETEKLKKQIRFERRILEEQKSEVEKKNNMLKLQLHAITQEIQNVVHSTPKLARQIEVASLTSVNDPGIYHLIFLQNILEFLKSFKKNIENASIWLATANKRANKRNFWNQYKVQKGTALLNPETYSQRSAG